MPIGSKVFVPEPEAAEILRYYNIPYPEHGLAKDPGEAVGIAEKIGQIVAPGARDLAAGPGKARPLTGGGRTA